METQITDLLQTIAEENPNYPFPIDTIRIELMEMLTNQEEFQYFLMQAYKKLKRDHPAAFNTIFLTTLAVVLDDDMTLPDTLPLQEYQNRIERLISTLENMRITRIEKNSPDGELMSAM